MSSAELKQALAEAAVVNGGGDNLSASDEPEKNLPMRKRKKGAGSTSPVPEDMPGTTPRKRGRPKGSTKKGRDEDDDFGMKAESDEDAVGGFTEAQTAAGTDDLKPIKRPPMSKAREIRLEQNRKAARESRRRKKVMIEELQRSVIFFSRANGTLKQQNDELQRMLVQAQTQIRAIEQNGGGAAAAQAKEAEAQPGPADVQAAPAPGADDAAAAPAPGGDDTDPADAQQAAAAAQAAQQSQAQAQAAQAATAQFQFQNMAQAQAQAAQAAATQAMYESQGYPPAAARAAAQTLVAQGGTVPAPGGTPAPSSADGSAAPPAPTAATMAANPFMAAMMGMGVQSAAAQAPGAAAPAPGAPAQAPGTTAPSPMDALNQFAMQQQFAAQLGAMGAAMPGVPAAAAANPALFQQQAAAMQLAAAGQMAAAAGGQWGAPAAAAAAGAPASGPLSQQQNV